MIKVTILVLALFALCSSAYCRLGETERELTTRFGAPVLNSPNSVIAQGKVLAFGRRLVFRQGDWSIACDVVDGKCLRIRYSHPGDWTEDQIETVLNSNGQGAKWTETSKANVAKLQRSWKRTDASVAVWQKGQGMTVTWDVYEKAKAKLEEQARVKAAQKPKI